MNSCRMPHTTRVTIRLKTNNLLYDIAQAGFLSAEAVALRYQDNQHVKHRMKDVVEDYRESYDYTILINYEHARFLAERLTSLLHDYLVSSAICRYISVVADTSHSSELYKQREEDTIGEIIAMLSMYDCERPITATM